jgi:putative ABC transport system substrate-binding protein
LPPSRRTWSRASPKVIVVSYTPNLVATAAATRTIPIVAVLPHRELRELGLIETDGHPGGNVTGLGGNPDTVYGKLVGLLKQTVPSLKRVGYLHNPNTPGSADRMKTSQVAAGQLGLEFIEVQAVDDAQMESTFASLATAGADGLVVESDIVFSISSPIVALRSRTGCPRSTRRSKAMWTTAA